MSNHDNFGFPYEPYVIQKDFMNALYKVLSDGKIGIFESPTGTVNLNSLLIPLDLVLTCAVLITIGKVSQFDLWIFTMAYGLWERTIGYNNTINRHSTRTTRNR
jgi:hypothetical protein